MQYLSIYSMWSRRFKAPEIFTMSFASTSFSSPIVAFSLRIIWREFLSVVLLSRVISLALTKTFCRSGNSEIIP